MTLSTLDVPTSDNRSTFVRWWKYLMMGEPLHLDMETITVNEQITTPGSLQWVSSVSEVEYQAFLSYLDEKIDAALNGKTLNFGGEDRAEENIGFKRNFHATITLVRSANRASLKACEIVSNILNDALLIIDQLTTFDGFMPSSNQSKEIKKKVIELYGSAYDLIQSRESTKYSTLEQWKQSASTKENMTSPANNDYDFSLLKPFKKVAERIQNVLNAIHEIETEFLNVEDAYVIKEIKESYLPNLYQAAIMVRKSSQENIELIEKDLDIQFDYMESEIENINKAIHDRAMHVIQKQTGFALAKMRERKAFAIDKAS
jgi:hypothetical protein